MNAATKKPAPNKSAPLSIIWNWGLARWAERRAPVTEPIAMIDVRSPYWLAPAWNTVTDIVAMKIAKLNPNVPIRKNMSSAALRSGRRLT
jgi:hypothetical protein